MEDKEFEEYILATFDDFAKADGSYTLKEVISLMRKAWEAKPVVKPEDLQQEPKETVYVTLTKECHERMMKQLEIDSRFIASANEYMQRVGAIMQQYDDRLLLLTELLKYKDKD